MVATDNAIPVGEFASKTRSSGRFWREFPLCPIRVFDTESERVSELDRVFMGGDGDNLIRVSRNQVVAWLGRGFAVIDRGEVCREWEG